MFFKAIKARNIACKRSYSHQPLQEQQAKPSWYHHGEKDLNKPKTLYTLNNTLFSEGFYNQAKTFYASHSEPSWFDTIIEIYKATPNTTQTAATVNSIKPVLWLLLKDGR